MLVLLQPLRRGQLEAKIEAERRTMTFIIITTSSTSIRFLLPGG
jgi:hypothetical protein